MCIVFFKINLFRTNWAITMISVYTMMTNIEHMSNIFFNVHIMGLIVLFNSQ
ncbi:MAG: hypothetical protein ACKPKO_11305 [Candidatus Fonsibacter sp.]